MQDPGLAVLVADFLADDQSLPEVIDGVTELAKVPEGVAETVVREAFAPPVAVLPGDTKCATRTVECIFEPGRACPDGVLPRTHCRRWCPTYHLRVFIVGCLLPDVSRGTRRSCTSLKDLWRLGAGETPAGMTQEQQRRVVADTARRALSEARILYRMDEADAALDAVNPAVLFSKPDPAARADALEFSAQVLREEGEHDDTSTLA